MKTAIYILTGFFVFITAIIYARNNVDWKKIEILNTRASQEINKQDWNALINTADEILKIHPGYEWGHYYYGLGFTHSGRLSEGEKQLKNALSVNPDNFWASYILFYNYVQQKNLSAERQGARVHQLLNDDIIKSHPQDIISFFILYYETLSKNKKYDEAGKLLKKAIFCYPRDPRINGYYAFTFFRKDQDKWFKLSKEAFELIPLNERSAGQKYQFPLKGENIRVLQGNNGKISHQGPFVAFDWDFIFTDNSGKYAGDSSRKEGHYIYDQPVYAAADGIVTETYDSSPDTEPMKNVPGFEPNHIYILHSGYETSKYNHLKKGTLTVKPGDKVKKGEMIAKVGCSGSYVDIPHLHFGITRGYLTVQSWLYGIAVQENGKWIAKLAYIPSEGDVLKSVW